MTSGAAVTVGLDQDKQPDFKIIPCPSQVVQLVHTHLLTLLNIMPSQVPGPEIQTGPTRGTHFFLLSALHSLCSAHTLNIDHITKLPSWPNAGAAITELSGSVGDTNMFQV